ncbi:hypothetical protein V462_12140 [Pantoea ananatis 15320]|nr:hypothetical protein V462_12140 [Pantoea ananatis 15320]
MAVFFSGAGSGNTGNHLDFKIEACQPGEINNATSAA